MAQTQKTVLKIAGVDYTVVSDEPLEYMQRVGNLVDQKLREVLMLNKHLNTAMAAVLASVNIADDYQKAHDQAQRLHQELQKCMTELSRLQDENEQLKKQADQTKQEMQQLQIELAKKDGRLQTRPDIHGRQR